MLLITSNSPRQIENVDVFQKKCKVELNRTPMYYVPPSCCCSVMGGPFNTVTKLKTDFSVELDGFLNASYCNVRRIHQILKDSGQYVTGNHPV